MNMQNPVYPEGPLGDAMKAMRDRDWQTAVDALAPFVGVLTSGNGHGFEDARPRDIVMSARVAAAAHEQMGDHENAARIWQAMFKKSQAANEEWPITLPDHCSLIRVQARLGTLDTETRRRFAGLLYHLVRERGMPIDEHRRFSAILRYHSGISFSTADAPQAAFESFGKAMHLVRRHAPLFRPMKSDIDDMSFRLTQLARSLGLKHWNGHRIAELSAPNWQQDGTE